MPKLDVLNMEGKKVKDITLSEEVFGVKPNEAVVHTVLVNYLANQRQGTASTKTRAEVRGRWQKTMETKRNSEEQDKGVLEHHIGLRVVLLWVQNQEISNIK